MIGKPEWFERRKFGGWGLNIKTWQGGVYIALIVIPFVIFQALPYWSEKTRLIVTFGWILFLSIDVIDIMRQLKKDERETLHEAISERNALWAVMAVLIIAVLYQVGVSVLNKSLSVDWWIVGALFSGAIVKSITNYKLDRRN